MFTLSNQKATILIGEPFNLDRFLDIVDSYAMGISKAFKATVFSGFGQFEHLKLSLIIINKFKVITKF